MLQILFFNFILQLLFVTAFTTNNLLNPMKSKDKVLLQSADPLINAVDNLNAKFGNKWQLTINGSTTGAGAGVEAGPGPGSEPATEAPTDAPTAPATEAPTDAPTAAPGCADTLWAALCSTNYYEKTGNPISGSYSMGFNCNQRTAPDYAQRKIDIVSDRQSDEVKSVGCTGASCYENYGCWGYMNPGHHWPGCTCGVFWSSERVTCTSNTWTISSTYYVHLEGPLTSARTSGSQGAGATFTFDTNGDITFNNIYGFSGPFSKTNLYYVPPTWNGTDIISAWTATPPIAPPGN